MLERVIVYVDRYREHVPMWQAAGKGLEITARTQQPDVDAVFLPLDRCDRYGLPRRPWADDELPAVIDTWRFGEAGQGPRYAIASPAWASEPPLAEAVERRVALLGAALDAHAARGAGAPPTRSAGAITALLLHVTALGAWDAAPRSDHERAIVRACLGLRSLLAAR